MRSKFNAGELILLEHKCKHHSTQLLYSALKMFFLNERVMIVRSMHSICWLVKRAWNIYTYAKLKNCFKTKHGPSKYSNCFVERVFHRYVHARSYLNEMHNRGVRNVGEKAQRLSTKIEENDWKKRWRIISVSLKKSKCARILYRYTVYTLAIEEEYSCHFICGIGW